ncbi:MAG: universal stress protein [Caldilineaceae bacterium]
MNLQNAANLGTNILIALGDRPTSLDLVRSVAGAIHAPKQTRITLMHYLMPIYWEHGGEENDPQALKERLQEELQVEEDEEDEEQRAQKHFAKAQAILQKVGVPAANVRTELAWEEVDAAHAVLDELKRGEYTSVIIGEHDTDFLTRLIDPPMAEIIRRHAGDVTVWTVPTAEEVIGD